MHKITDLEFRRFSAKHHNASRNWLIPIIKTNDPEIFGIGDASSLGEDEIIIEETKYLFEKFLIKVLIILLKNRLYLPV